MKKFFNKGYQLYSPPKTISYHLWERAYRKTYKEDHQEDTSRKQHQFECLQKIKDAVYTDHEFMQEMKKRGVDMENR
jgi:Glycosyltransferase (GlcNAc)